MDSLYPQRWCVLPETRGVVTVGVFAVSPSTDEFWTDVNTHQFSNIKKVVVVMLVMFGSTYTCESSFSRTNSIKKKKKAALIVHWLTVLFTIVFSLHWHLISQKSLPLFRKRNVTCPSKNASVTNLHINIMWVCNKPCLIKGVDLKQTYVPSVWISRCCFHMCYCNYKVKHIFRYNTHLQ